MTRTLPNRVATHAAATIPPVAYADAIAGAVAFLHAQLRNPDVAVGMAAAMALLDLEKTRMRHGQPVPATVPHIAAGLPAGVTPSDATTLDRMTNSDPSAHGSPADLHGAESPAGKPAAIWPTPVDSPPNVLERESPAGEPAAICKIATGHEFAGHPIERFGVTPEAFPRTMDGVDLSPASA